MYKSPIEVKLSDLFADTVKKSDAVGKADEYIVRYVQQVSVSVDKDELIKALEYDRGQYEKGWNDRDNEIVRCKDCRYAHMTYDGECKYCDVWEAEGEMYLDGDFYCAFGERKEDERT